MPVRVTCPVRITDRQNGTFIHMLSLQFPNQTATAPQSLLQDCLKSDWGLTQCSSCPFHLLGQGSTRPSPSHFAGPPCRPTRCPYTHCSGCGSSSSFSRRSQRNPVELLRAVMHVVFLNRTLDVRVIDSKTVSSCCVHKSSVQVS